MGRIKISRKKLLQEPDEFLSLSQRVWLWVHDNRGRAAAAVGIFAGALLAVFVIKGLVSRGREQRLYAVAQAVGRYTEPKDAGAPADASKLLEDLAAKHAGSEAGTIARFFLAGSLAGKGELSRAGEQFAKVGQEAGKGSELAMLSRAAQGYLALAGGDQDGALAAFQELIASKDAVVPRAQLRLEVAQIHERKGSASEARRIYEELSQAGGDNLFSAKAKERLRSLDERAKAAS